MAKIQLKSDNINPFGGLFSILNIFNRSGLRSVVDRHRGRRGMTRAAFTHGHQSSSSPKRLWTMPLHGTHLKKSPFEVS